MNHRFISHRIRCNSIIGGFLDETSFELADGLNCFNGARGAGKTTLPAFVRYVLDAVLSHPEWIKIRGTREPTPIQLRPRTRPRVAVSRTSRRSDPSFGTQPDKLITPYLTNVR